MRGARAWLLALALAGPVIALYGLHLFGAAQGMTPTGFIQYDQLYYMANAREIADGGHWLTYGNAFGPDYASAPVYFQPIAALLGAVMRLTGIDPGALYVVFGSVAVLTCLRAIVALYARTVPERDLPALIGLFLFGWGGGLLIAAALVRGMMLWVYDPLAYDPLDGFWFLNLGRNLVFPTEAFHHALFLGAMLLVLARRWLGAALVAALLSASHPFTGIELLDILLGWALLERVVLRHRAPPWWFIAALAVLIVAHAGYYLVWLRHDPDHQALFAQWTAMFAIASWRTLALSYALVGSFTVLRLVRAPSLKAVFANPRERLFAVWFLGAFALANNDLVMAPIQPLHFTRGYDWTPLFLLGAPALVTTIREMLARREVSGAIAAAALCGLFVSDNALWLGITADKTPAIWLTPGERAFFAWASQPENRGAVLLADHHLAYAATAYTPLRGWFTHRFNTPHSDAREQELTRFLTSGALPPGAARTPLLIVADTGSEQNPQVIPAAAREVYRRGGVTAWRINPAADPAGSPPP